MIVINGKNLEYVEGYEPYVRNTKEQYYRNPLTGTLYREKLPGLPVQFHIFEVVLDDDTYEWLKGLYIAQKSGNTVKLQTEKTDGEVECVFTPDEFRLKRVVGETPYWEGTIVLEEVQTK